MKNKFSKLSRLLGATLGAALFGASAQAHECHALGQSRAESPGLYWLCAGFAVEDGFRPRAGAYNNLDFLPIWVEAGHDDEYVDTRKGDIVNFEAKLIWLKSPYFAVPADAETRAPDDQHFFFKQTGYGFSQPIPVPTFVRDFNHFHATDLDDEGEIAVTYRVPSDFITPYAGQYAWIFKGVMKRRGHPLIAFEEKFVSQAPRIPWGPRVVDGAMLDNFWGSPEGWFDGVRPANYPGQPMARGKAFSPLVSQVMKWHKKK